jgi:hypothetical protein
MPFGSVAYEPAGDVKGEPTSGSIRASFDRLKAMCGPGESCSDVIVRLAAGEAR